MKDIQKNLVKDIKIFLKKEKEKKQQHGCECYKNLSEDEKQNLQKNTLQNEKNCLIIITKNTDLKNNALEICSMKNIKVF